MPLQASLGSNGARQGAANQSPPSRRALQIIPDENVRRPSRDEVATAGLHDL